MEQEFQGTAGRYLEESIPWWPPVATAPEGAPNVLVVLLDSGFPGYDATMPMANGMLVEILVRRGYSTFCLGKWHLSPAHEMAPGGSKQRWPVGRGFERFYGFLPGETDQYHPDLTYDNHQVSPPKSPEDGYHLTEDLADKAVSFLADLRAVAPTKPFLMWFAPGACHSPHQAPRSFIDGYAGQFDLGWDTWREKVFAKQKASGLLPDGTRLSDRPQWVPAWDSLGAVEKRLDARMMEVYAGFLDHTDAQVGKVIAAIESYGELDNTIVIVMSDNGASAELIELWWSEAERNQVLPITNMPGKHNDFRHRRERYEFRPGIGALPETVAPNLRNRAWRITATVTPDINGRAEGVICAHGSASAGYALYVAQGRLHYVNNTLGASVTTITSEAELPAHGPTTVRCEFTPTGRFQGEVCVQQLGTPVIGGLMM